MANQGNKAKNGKKTGRRLKRTVRKTLGALFLVTALVIGAIPVEGLQAADGDSDIALVAAGGARDTNNKSVKPEANIPKIPKTINGRAVETYTAGDKVFQFVYIPNGSNYTAIIVGYARGMLPEGSLTLPDTVDAYKQYTANDGQYDGYVAVGRDGNFLFYRRTETIKIKEADLGRYTMGVAPDYYETVGSSFTETDAAGNTETYINLKHEIGNFELCSLGTNGDISAWSQYANSLYYDSDHAFGEDEADSLEFNNPYAEKFKKVDSDAKRRITNVTVDYISDQYYDTTTQNWEKVKSDHPENGVFAKTGNIVNLSWGDHLKGVGDYAFYECANLDSITFKNGLNVIGEGAFSKCSNLKTVTMPRESDLSAIGAMAFMNCTQLTSFSMPTKVDTIGDSAFEGCMRLREITLCSSNGQQGDEYTYQLSTLGQDVFKNCESLESLTFPEGCSAQVYLSCFEGCKALKFICARNSSMSFPQDGAYYTYDEFKAMLGADTDFYFEGVDPSALHEMCKENCFAFSYIGGVDAHYAKENLYEITMKDGTGTSTYVVDNNNVLVEYDNENVSRITIPVKIGPYRIETIGSGVFQNFCNLKEVTILDTVTKIEGDAFKGCHNLEFVNFSSENIQIAPGAFNTQDIVIENQEHKGAKCDCDVEKMDDIKEDGYPKCKLHFVGPISPKSGSFNYAMDTNEYGMYSNGSQLKSYIIYCSGLPQQGVVYTQNLEIVYNPEKRMSELVDFPSLEELRSPTKYIPEDYAYINADFTTTAMSAVSKYTASPKERLEPEEQKIIDSALNIVIPDGVEAIKPGLFKEKEDKNYGEEMTVKAYSSLSAIDGEKFSEDGKLEEAGTFVGCEKLTSVTLTEGSEAKETVIGDYAFQNCKGLQSVTMDPIVTSMGIAPFYGCSGLSNVTFNPQSSTSPYQHFACVNGIIYGLDTAGNKDVLIECLEGRETPPYGVTETEVAGVSKLQKEAFRGSKVRSVNLRRTTITEIPEGTFAETEELETVYFPSSLEYIEDYAFAGSAAVEFHVYGRDTTAGAFAFAGIDDNSPYDKAGLLMEPSKVSWNAIPGSVSARTGERAKFIPGELEVEPEYNVNFEYYNNEGEYTYNDNAQIVEKESDIIFPDNVAEQVTVNNVIQFFTGKWEKIRDDETTRTWTYKAEFLPINHSITVMDSPERGSAILGGHPIEVPHGQSAINALDTLLKENVPEDVYKSFAGWSCSGNLDAVTEDLIATATYTVAGEYSVRYYVMKDSYGNYELYDTKTVKEGEAAPDLASPKGEGYEIEGYRFVEWENLPTNVTDNLSVYAKYEPGRGGNSGTAGMYLVEYYVMQNTYGNYVKFGEQQVAPGGSAPDLAPPRGTEYEVAGYTFSKWGDLPTNVNRDWIIYALYVPTSGGNGDGSGGGNGDTPSNPTPAPGTIRYNLSVKDGSGSGSYLPGTQIIVSANAPAKGHEFASWTVSPADTTVTDPTLSSIIITMPDHDVALVANYKASSSSSNGGGTNDPNGSGSNRPSPSTVSSGTTVVIDKNGLSNTGVVSVTVRGSSDNFTVKVTENTSATEAILRALRNEYGTLDNLKYFPMDISLYDSTGTRKITDTTGLSISITLPLPDSLIAYAGNNKVAGVVNDKLDKLTPRFTTINGVACVTFTAEHFSPYVIYVDVTNLSDGTVTDSTPKTADGIHPKWFLVIGFACLSFVMFMMKDGGEKNKKKQKVAVKVKA